MCVYVVSEVEDADGDYIYLLAGTASHGWVPWFLSVRVPVCNLDYSELVKYLWTYKNSRMVAGLFFKKMFSRNLAEWVWNEPKINYLNLFAKYRRNVLLQMLRYKV